MNPKRYIAPTVIGLVLNIFVIAVVWTRILPDWDIAMIISSALLALVWVNCGGFYLSERRWLREHGTHYTS